MIPYNIINNLLTPPPDLIVRRPPTDKDKFEEVRQKII